MDYLNGFTFTLDNNNLRWKKYFDGLGRDGVGVYSVSKYFYDNLKDALLKIFEGEADIASLSPLSEKSLNLSKDSFNDWDLTYKDYLSEGETCCIAIPGYLYKSTPQSCFSIVNNIVKKQVTLSDSISISEYAQLVEDLFVLRFGKKPQDLTDAQLEYFIPAQQIVVSQAVINTVGIKDNNLEMPINPEVRECKETVVEGYFYLRNGVPDREHNRKYKETGKSKKVYCINEIKENYLSSDCVELPYEYDEFRTICNIIKQECTSMDENEFKAVAYASYNHSKVIYKKSSSWLTLLNTGYSSVERKNKVVLEDQANEANANLARRAVIYVLEGKNDMTDGAEFWDGGDFLAIGLETDPWGKKGQGKFRQYKFIEIPADVYNSYKFKWSKTTQTYKPHGHTKDIIHTPKETHTHTDTRIVYINPAKVFTDKANRNKNNDFYYETGVNETYGITATLCAGDSIFWKLLTTRTTSKE